MARVKSDDTVLVIAGKDRGKRGKVTHILPAKDRVTVAGLNIVKRHTKPGQAQQSNIGGSVNNGGIIEKENPLPLSTLMYVCVKCNTPTRVRHQAGSTGSRQRVCAKCGEPARESIKG